MELYQIIFIGMICVFVFALITRAVKRVGVLTCISLFLAFLCYIWQLYWFMPFIDEIVTAMRLSSNAEIPESELSLSVKDFIPSMVMSVFVVTSFICVKRYLRRKTLSSVAEEEIVDCEDCEDEEV